MPMSANFDSRSMVCLKGKLTHPAGRSAMGSSSLDCLPKPIKMLVLAHDFWNFDHFLVSFGVI